MRPKLQEKPAFEWNEDGELPNLHELLRTHFGNPEEQSLQDQVEALPYGSYRQLPEKEAELLFTFWQLEVLRDRERHFAYLRLLAVYLFAALVTQSPILESFSNLPVEQQRITVLLFWVACLYNALIWETSWYLQYENGLLGDLANPFHFRRVKEYEDQLELQASRLGWTKAPDYSMAHLQEVLRSYDKLRMQFMREQRNEQDKKESSSLL